MLMQLLDIHTRDNDTANLFERVTKPYSLLLLDDLVLEETLRLMDTCTRV